MPDLAVWPTDGADGSVSSEARWRKMARFWVPSGVDNTPLGIGGATALAPTLAAGPTINVAIGGCWLDGHYAELTAPASVPASANGILVVRFTPADNHAELLWRDAATLPPTQTLVTWELAIASMAAGAMTDRRIQLRSGSPPCFPNYATLKALLPTPPDGFQAVTLDDGRTWTFRAASFTPSALVGALPANRWETRASVVMTGAATDSGGTGSIPASALGLDGLIAVFGGAGFSAAAFPQLFVGSVRWSSQTACQIRLYSMSAASGASVANLASASNQTIYLDFLGYRV